MRPLLKTAIVVGFLAICGPSSAHLFYLDVRSAEAHQQQLIAVDVRVGHAFSGDVLPHMADHIDRFVAITPDGLETDLTGIDGRAPAGFAPLTQDDSLILYQSKGVTHTLTRSGFEAYADEEGVMETLKQLPPSATGFETEVFQRCAKTVLSRRLSEHKSSWSVAAQETGCDLDILAIPRTVVGDPEAVHFRVVLRGQPLEGALVKFVTETGVEQSARSDQNGVIALMTQSLAGQGALLVSTVHLEPAEHRDGRRMARWLSTWATLMLPELSDHTARSVGLSP